MDHCNYSGLKANECLTISIFFSKVIIQASSPQHFATGLIPAATKNQMNCAISLCLGKCLPTSGRFKPKPRKRQTLRMQLKLAHDFVKWLVILAPFWLMALCASPGSIKISAERLDEGMKLSILFRLTAYVGSLPLTFGSKDHYSVELLRKRKSHTSLRMYAAHGFKMFCM